jgi:hypothetical protein
MRVAARQIVSGATTGYGYKVGDWVLAVVDVDGIDGGKRLFTGPFKVMAADPVRNRYTLEPNDMVTRVRQLERTGDLLKPWNGSEGEQFVADRVGAGGSSRDSAIAAAIVDSQVFEGKQGAEELRLFRVRWSSYQVEDDSWVEGKQLTRTKAFQQYVKEHKDEAWAEAWLRRLPRLTDQEGKSLEKTASKKRPARGGGIAAKETVVPAVESDEVGIPDKEGDLSTLESIREGASGTDGPLDRGTVANATMSEPQQATSTWELSMMEDGMEFNQEGVEWPAGRSVSGQTELTEVRAVFKKTYRGHGSRRCTNCQMEGMLLQCSFCMRAYHPRCMSMKVLPREQDEWLCPFCAFRVWPKGPVEIRVPELSQNSIDRVTQEATVVTAVAADLLCGNEVTGIQDLTEANSS